MSGGNVEFQDCSEAAGERRLYVDILECENKKTFMYIDL